MGIKREHRRRALAVAVFTVLATACTTTPKQESKSDGKPAAPVSQAKATPPAQTNERSTPPPKPAMICSKSNDERAIEVVEVDAGCWVMYRAHGIKKRVAHARHGTAYCESARDRIRHNLEIGQYKCRSQE